ncbi:MAG: DNA polymerase III subunit delta' [Alphaproteobacteria bacterium]|nr:DNA polymerase III subunit delta' [Alphaproteobacteria bacterium]
MRRARRGRSPARSLRSSPSDWPRARLNAKPRPMATSEPGDASLDPPPPHVRSDFTGHEAVVQTLTAAIRRGRLAHAILLGGPPGIGKATLAYRLARALLSGETRDDLSVPPEHTVSRLVAARAHPDLMVLERPYDREKKKLKNDLPVEEVRRLASFFGQTAALGGARVAIIDAADDMNRAAANALLKVLEEPPARASLILVAHAPGALLATIRSRCRLFAMRPLPTKAVEALLGQLAPETDAARRRAVAALAKGSPGEALALLLGEGPVIESQIIQMLASWPHVKPAAIASLVNETTGRGNEAGFALVTSLLTDTLRRAIRQLATGLTEPGDPPPRVVAALQQGGVEYWLGLWEKLTDLFTAADRVNLDKRQVLTSAFSLLRADASPDAPPGSRNARR